MVVATPDPDHVYLLTDAKDKKRIREILTERGLASYMNDTKWRELCRGMYQLPFPPAYQVKYVHQAPETHELEYAPAYFGDWARTHEASLGLHIEWIRIAPRYTEHRGLLVSPVIQDCSSELIALLTRIHVPFIEQDSFVVIYGHGSASTPI
ncbi:DUF6678 family protein [Aminobacter sp. BA135]|uniref:DUF6678 family protein n=1 Tax=Aminobacter sp. BA135 TaxID=537596 RepID=UPI003D7BADB8